MHSNVEFLYYSRIYMLLYFKLNFYKIHRYSLLFFVQSIQQISLYVFHIGM
jgi:hypothetical protein